MDKDTDRNNKSDVRAVLQHLLKQLFFLYFSQAPIVPVITFPALL